MRVFIILLKSRTYTALFYIVVLLLFLASFVNAFDPSLIISVHCNGPLTLSGLEKPYHRSQLSFLSMGLTLLRWLTWLCTFSWGKPCIRQCFLSYLSHLKLNRLNCAFEYNRKIFTRWYVVREFLLVLKTRQRRCL